jgi:hypothetical protein
LYNLFYNARGKILVKNRTLKIMLGTGIILLFVVAGASGGPAIIFFPSLIVGALLTVVSLWIMLTGLPKALFVLGTIIGIIGLIVAYFGGREFQCTAMIIIGFGLLFGCIGILAGYTDIEDVTGWDRDL